MHAHITTMVILHLTVSEGITCLNSLYYQPYAIGLGYQSKPFITNVFQLDCNYGNHSVVKTTCFVVYI